MTVKGGMTPHYQANQGGAEGKEADGRYRMAKELQDKHPDVTTITRKWGRWQHQVNYKPFRKNALRLKPGVVIENGVDNYGMDLKILSEEAAKANASEEFVEVVDLSEPDQEEELPLIDEGFKEIPAEPKPCFCIPTCPDGRCKKGSTGSAEIALFGDDDQK